MYQGWAGTAITTKGVINQCRSRPFMEHFGAWSRQMQPFFMGSSDAAGPPGLDDEVRMNQADATDQANGSIAGWFSGSPARRIEEPA